MMEADKRMERVEASLAQVVSGLISLQRTMVFGVIAMTSAVLAAFGAAITQI